LQRNNAKQEEDDDQQIQLDEVLDGLILDNEPDDAMQDGDEEDDDNIAVGDRANKDGINYIGREDGEQYHLKKLSCLWEVLLERNSSQRVLNSLKNPIVMFDIYIYGTSK
jgi:hypothetical protein